MKKRFTYLIGFMFFHIVSFSQNNNHFINFNRQDGLTNNFVQVIYEDNYGYMWFGTRNGLNRFDGVNIDEYKKTVDTKKSLNGNAIYDILHTSNGKLLIGNNAGLNIFDYKTEDFSKVKRLNSSKIYKIVEDKNQNIWIITGSDLVLKLDKELNKVAGFSFAELIKKQFNVTTSAIRVFKYDEENLIMNIKGKGFYLFNFNSYEFKLKVKYVFQSPTSLVKVLKISDTEFWLATFSGVYVYKDNDFSRYFKTGNSNKYLNSGFVHDLQKMNSNEVWMFTDGGGINVYDLTSNEFRYIKQNARDDFSINSNFLYTSFISKDSTLWVGSVKNGVSQLIKNNAFFTYKLRSLKGGIRSNYPVSSLFLDANDRIWIGSDGNGLYKFEEGSLKHVYTDGEVKTIWSIFEYYPGHLLLGAYGHGIYSYEVGSRKSVFQSILHKNARPYNSMDIVKDAQGDFVINLSKSIKIDGNIKNPNKLLNISNIISNNALSSYVDKELALTLFGNSSGLYKFIDNDFILVTNVPKMVISIKHYRDNLFWLATNKGICLVNIDSGETVFYSIESGLNIESIHSMVKSDSDNLWIGSYLGVSKFDVKSRKFSNYTYKNGFLDNEFIKPYAVKLKSGKLFFGGLKGILSFDPKEIKEPEDPKSVVFTRLRINHEPVEDSNPLGVYEYIADVKELTLDHTQKVLTIDFSTFEYAYPEKIRFSYKLEGYDSEWSETNNRSLTYMNLPQGKYTLKVKASNEVGEWGNSVSSVEIKVLPAWWQTWWFYLLVVLSMSGAVLFVIWDMLRRQRVKSNYEFEKESLNKQLELDDQQLRFFTNLSHEIRTPLSLIVSPIRTIIDDEAFNPKNIKNLNLIEKNAQRIEKLINRGIDFRKTQFKEPELQAQKIDIVSFLRNLVEGFQGISSINKIALNFKSHISERIIWMDQHMIETIFYNLMSNAIRYSGKNGVVNFEISEDKENVIITIEDFGVGITKDDSEHIFERFFQTQDHIGGSGIGLALTKRFVEAHLGSISVESEKGKGSCFKVVMPFGNDQNYKEFIRVSNKVKVVKSQNIQLDESDKKENHLFKNKSLLIVEDEDNLRDYLETNLGNEYNVVAVENGKLALDLIQIQNFDMVVSDITMPEMDGLELCKLLKENSETSTIPIILLTARIMDKDKIRGYDLGADAYVEKPFQLELLKSQIGNLLERQVRRKNELLELLGVSKNSITVSNSDEKFYAQVIAIIEKNIGNYNFDIPLFASEIGMSKSLLYKRIKAVSSVSINELILGVRLKKAVQLLIYSKESIVDISSSVGFKNAKYFSTSFKKKYNESPSNYRKDKAKSKTRLS